MLDTITQSAQSTQLLLFSHTKQIKPKIILGLSGGPDSVFLFHVLKKMHDAGTITLIAAHLDHGWRAESGNDAQFCKDLCAQANIDLIVAHARDLDLVVKPNGSAEEIGRKLRRHFFQTTLQNLDADFIALAHHQQDQQETFFMRMMRGSSLHGLTCMKPVDGVYLRPLLHTNKQVILEYLDLHAMKYVHDATNNSDDFLRNRIRKYVLPALEKCDQRFDQKFESTLQHLQAEHDFLHQITHEAFQKNFYHQEDPLSMVGKLEIFYQQSEALQKRILVYWLIQEHVSFSPSDAYLDEILRFLLSPRGGSHQMGSSWKLCKQAKKFWIEKA